MGEFLITNEDYWSELADPTSDDYRIMTKSIEEEVIFNFHIHLSHCYL